MFICYRIYLYISMSWLSRHAQTGFLWACPFLSPNILFWQ